MLSLAHRLGVSRLRIRSWADSCLQPWFNRISVAALLQLEAALRLPHSPHPAVAIAAAEAHALLSQVPESTNPTVISPLTLSKFLHRAYAVDSGVFATSSSVAKRERAAFLRSPASSPAPSTCDACKNSPAKQSGISSFFAAKAPKPCAVCLHTVCAACMSHAGWCGNRACTRCSESLGAVGLKSPTKPSLLSSLRKMILPGNADRKEKAWLRDYTFDRRECAPTLSSVPGSEAVDNDELRVRCGA